MALSLVRAYAANGVDSALTISVDPSGGDGLVIVGSTRNSDITSVDANGATNITAVATQNVGSPFSRIYYVPNPSGTNNVVLNSGLERQGLIVLVVSGSNTASGTANSFQARVTSGSTINGGALTVAADSWVIGGATVRFPDDTALTADDQTFFTMTSGSNPNYNAGGILQGLAYRTGVTSTTPTFSGWSGAPKDVALVGFELKAAGGGGGGGNPWYAYAQQ